MTHDEFISLVKQPELVSANHAVYLKEMIELYPYFSPARLFHAKALQKSNSVLFGANMKFASLFSANQRWLYYYIYPDRKISTEPYKRDRNASKSSGDYFDMMSVVELGDGDSKQTLKDLAVRLKSAREMVISSLPKPIAEPVEIIVPEYEIKENELAAQVETLNKPVSVDYYQMDELDLSECNAKKLIREHKYMEAIEILKLLNLNNPKKSVYFADQIRFLEKVIVNSKK